MPTTAPPLSVDLRDLRLDTAVTLLGRGELPPTGTTPAQYLQRLIDGLCDLSLRDPLTGLANRRQFQAVLEREIDRVTRSGEAALLLMLDIDHFKRVNDTYGHPAGDKVIQLVAEVVREVIRESDIAGRYGGEEFVVLLPDVDKIGARLFAERLRQLVEALVVDYEGQEIRFTISLGVADLGQRTQDHQQLIDWADRALYQSKHGGRNQVSVHGG